MTLLDRFRHHLAELAPAPGTALVAVSGGADSLALLDLLVRCSDAHALGLVVAHVDHGLAAESAAVAGSVARAAERYALPFASVRLDLPAGTGETGARTARWAALRHMARELGASLIVTAHHADDQAETVLMRALRGSGPAGLAAMRPSASGVLRPLLPFRREELARYVRERGLDAWSDPANEDERHLRSWLRHRVFPVLETRLDEVVPRLSRVAASARRNAEAWEQMLEALPALEFRFEPDGVSVAAHALAGYDSRIGEALVAALGRRAGVTIGPRRAARLLALAAEGRSGSTVPLGEHWRGEVSFGRIRVYPAEAANQPALTLSGDEEEARWGRWRVRLTREAAPRVQERGGMTAWVPPGPLTIRSPRPGERIIPLGGVGRRLVVRCFQDARVSRSRRAGWAVIDVAGEAVWVPGVCRTEALIPREGAEALRVDVAYE